MHLLLPHTHHPEISIQSLNLFVQTFLQLDFIIYKIWSAIIDVELLMNKKKLQEIKCNSKCN